MIRTRRHLPALAAVALLGSLVGVAPASAKTGTILPTDVSALPRGGEIEYGSVSLKLGGGNKAKLAGKLTGTGGAKVKGGTVTFDPATTGGALDVTQMVGVVPVVGSLTIKGSKGTAKLSSIAFNPGGDAKNVTAKLGSKLLLLGSLKGGRATFAKQSDGTLSGAKVALSSRAAKAINAKTGAGLSAGTLGTLTIDVTGRELPIKDGTATMTLDPQFLQILANNGMDITATPPAVRSGNSFTVQLAGGAFDPEGLTGRLALEGQVTIGKPGLAVNLFGWRAVVNKRQKDLYASVNDGVAAAIANLDVANVEAFIKDGVFSATGAKVTLAKIAVDVLHQQFGVSVPVGLPLGTVSLQGHLNGA